MEKGEFSFGTVEKCRQQHSYGLWLVAGRSYFWIFTSLFLFKRGATSPDRTRRHLLTKLTVEGLLDLRELCLDLRSHGHRFLDGPVAAMLLQN